MGILKKIFRKRIQRTLESDEIKRDLSIKLKEIRTKKGLSQNDVARKLFVSRQALSNWERGITIPTVPMLIRISDVYNVSLSKLYKRK